MQTLLLPATTAGISSAAVRSSYPPHYLLRHCLSLRPLSFNPLASNPHPLFPLKSSLDDNAKRRSPPVSSSSHGIRRVRRDVAASASSSSSTASAAASPSPSPFGSAVNEADKAKLAQVTKRLEKTSRYFKRLGNFGFWGQLVCTLVAAVILSFSVIVTGKPTSPATFYATAGGIAAAFVSVFWSFGYIRLSEKLRNSANDPSKAPPRADVVKGLKSGIIVNLLGMGAAILGMQATVGFLVAKALTTSTNPFYQGVSPGYSPVLALDVFLVQASANTILSHFIGLVCSLGLLSSVTLPPSEGVLVPKVA